MVITKYYSDIPELENKEYNTEAEVIEAERKVSSNKKSIRQLEKEYDELYEQYRTNYAEYQRILDKLVEAKRALDAAKDERLISNWKVFENVFKL